MRFNLSFTVAETDFIDPLTITFTGIKRLGQSKHLGCRSHSRTRQRISGYRWLTSYADGVAQKEISEPNLDLSTEHLHSAKGAQSFE